MSRRGSRGGRKSKVSGSVSGSGAVAPGKPEAAGAVNFSGFDGARNNERRGTVRWHTLDTSKEVSPRDRLELMRKTRAAEANIGIVKRAIGGLSGLVGHLTPQSKALDSEFRKRAEEEFFRQVQQPAAFDLAGKLDFWSWQDMLKRAKRRDGDALTVLAEGRDGGGRILFYEGHQFGNGSDLGAVPEGLRDGVYLDKWGGRAAFQLLDGDGKRVSRVSRDRAIYHSDMERSGRPREISSMAHALSNVFDTMEILGFTKHAIKAASIWGAVLETSLKSDGGAQVANDVKAMWGAAGSAAEPGGEGDVISVESLTQGGRFQGLNPGQSIKTIHDDRPHPNILNMLSWLIRDIAWGAGVAPEVLWDASGLNGTSMRYVMAETRRWVENEQRKLRADCQRLWTYFLAKAAKAGRLEIPAGLERWWECEWIPQADLTIDEGRVGALELKQLELGVKSQKIFHGSKGRDWEEQEYQVQYELKRKREIYLEVHGVAMSEG
jgi:capsid protein